MDESDAFVIVASDGLWDCISNEEAVNIVHDTGVRLPLLNFQVARQMSYTRSALTATCKQSAINLKHLTVITQDAASSSSPSLHHLKTHCLSVHLCCPHSDAEVGVRLQ